MGLWTVRVLESAVCPVQPTFWHSAAAGLQAGL